ncbi:histidine kinase [Vibrio sp. Of7-15]|uniref:sensor histidine kinase n=1 Tax=Vibrio sp. Of7-15 TaxID=2724879 RepID=UPI001EF1C2A8|nr:histidine kinase [Vibrio sp. Of7-15]MCG7495645.1 histidine kinase [Vibrio sp. Of7-15]
MRSFFSKVWNWGGGFLSTAALCSLVATIITIQEPGTDPWSDLRVFIISYSYGICCHFSIHFWGIKFPEQPLVTRYLVPAFLGFLSGTALIIIISHYFDVLFEQSIWGDISNWISQVLLYALVVSGGIIFFFFSYHQKLVMKIKLEQSELEKERKDKEILLSELKLLQSQIEPHFLFNALANLKAMILLDTGKSVEYLDHFTNLLRQSLLRTREKEVTLNDEVSFCKSYLAIQKIRLDERLTVKFYVDKQIDVGQSFPPLLLQPLVENAILHGIEGTSKPCTLSVNISTNEKNTMRILVEEDGVGLGNSQHKGHGVGLNNIRSRITTLYGEEASLSISENTMGGVTVQLALPMKEAT